MRPRGGRGLENAAAQIAPIALTGPGIDLYQQVSVDDGEGGTPVPVKLVRGPTSVDSADCEAQLAALKTVVSEAGGLLVVIDYTHPTAVNANAALYARVGVPFVMGTTGGDRDALLTSITSGFTNHASGFAAVVAPNMGKQIVALQATLERMAADFPGSFAGYELKITESHQSTKADTSGTAKAIAKSLATLVDPNVPFDVEKITRVRSIPAQLAGAPAEDPQLNCVPEGALGGHAFHTYSLKKGSVEFQWRHNVAGRRLYAEGTADAVLFLAGVVAGGASKPVFDMVDVLEAGALD
mmetsp:Transcript_28414/g.95688  ORF Transcript_28414/g.95688 Transcript_28414/m.95688 type:complete len:297 (+) Transcript_28414:351-1241(+)